MACEFCDWVVFTIFDTSLYFGIKSSWGEEQTFVQYKLLSKQNRWGRMWSGLSKKKGILTLTRLEKQLIYEHLVHECERWLAH